MSVWRLASYMRPYSGRFVVVVVLVVLSSYGETLDGLSGRRVGPTRSTPRLSRRLSLLSSGEMAFPQYTGRVADWIMNEDEPDAFTEAITVMTLMTIAR